MMHLPRLGATSLCAAFLFPMYASAQEASIGGTVTDTAGAPVADAAIVIRAAAGPSTHTDASGRFRIAAVAPGTYSVTVVKAGFIDQTIDGVTAPTSDLHVVLAPATLSTLKSIASVRSVRGTLNDSASAIVDLPRSRFSDIGQIQIGHVLDQVPGVVSARPGSANAAAPGSITSPNLRGALDYEKATLLDGHPLINGRFGDYPTMLVNSMLFDNVEVVAGPTAYAPEINYGIGGTLNFQTGMPTRKPSGDAMYGIDNTGGSYANLRYSGSTNDGRLGYLFNFVSYGTQGPLHSFPTNFAVSPGTSIDGYGVLTGSTTTPATEPKGTLGGSPVGNVSLVACCQLVNSDFLNRGELAKLQYHFSNSTVFTAAYVGIQALYDGAAGGLTLNQSTFTPTGGSVLLNTRATLPDTRTYDNEPTFEGELRTTIANDTVLARYYSAILARQTTSLGLNDPTSNYTTGQITLNGTGQVNGVDVPFDDVKTTLTIPVPYSNSIEHDALHGISFEYDHPVGDNVFTFAFDRNTSLTNQYTLSGNPKDPSTPLLRTGIAAGTRQDFSTYLLRAALQLNSKTQLTLANYFNVYQNRYTPSMVVNSFIFANSTSTHDDPRLGIVYRPNADLSLRLSAGSAIAPPYPQLIDNLNTTAAAAYAANPTATTLTISQNSGTIAPETSFGYDLGGDWRMPNGAVLSADAYLTNLHDQFVGIIYPSATPYTPPGSTTPIPVYITTNANLSQSRFEGIDATLRYDPARGAGYTFAFALQRAYAYGLTPAFYTSAAGPYTTNLGVVDGANFYGFNAPFFNGISNKSEAYSQGYAAVHLRGAAGQYAELGFTLYGANNTYNIPAFVVTSASYRQPIGSGTSLQLSADNIFGADSAPYVTYGTGIPAPLANGGVGLRSTVPYGPAVWRLTLLHSL